MPGTFTYGLYPFAWDAAAKCHAPPAGSACVLDLRPLSEQAKASQSSGYGLFAWASGPPGDLVSIGTGYAPELLIDNAARNELKLKLGLSANPAGATLADAMADVLGSLADPTGTSMAKPIMPTSSGTLDLHLEGHSRIWSQAIDSAELLSANPRGKHNRIRDVIRADLDVAEATGGVSLLQQCLGAWLLKLGVSREEVRQGASGKKSQYDRLMSAAVKGRYGPKAKPADPKTQIVESWPTDGAITSGQDETWAAVSTAVWSGSSYLIASGGYLKVSYGNSFYSAARCEAAVSSADHWAQGNIDSNGTYASGLAARMGSADTAYFMEWGWQGRGALKKYVSGALTSLATGSGSGSITNTFAKCRANGSTITGTITGQSDLVVTDTAITGNLKGGASLIVGTGAEGSVRVGAITIDDGLNPPAATPWLYARRSARIIGG